MTEDNKLRLKQLGWGRKASRPVVVEHRFRSTHETRMLKLEGELKHVRKWLERLAVRYREKGYDAEPIDRIVGQITEALKL